MKAQIAPMRNPDNIAVLTRAYALVESLYESPLAVRGRRTPGLSPQLFRSAGSIPYNIAEGAALDDAGFVKHLTIAIGSANEAEKQLRMAHRFKLLGRRDGWHVKEVIEIRKMTIGLRKSVLRNIKDDRR